MGGLGCVLVSAWDCMAGAGRVMISGSTVVGVGLFSLGLRGAGVGGRAGGTWAGQCQAVCEGGFLFINKGGLAAQLAVSTGCHLAVRLVISQVLAVISTGCHLALISHYSWI